MWSVGWRGHEVIVPAWASIRHRRTEILGYPLESLLPQLLLVPGEYFCYLIMEELELRDDHGLGRDAYRVKFVHVSLDQRLYAALLVGSQIEVTCHVLCHSRGRVLHTGHRSMRHLPDGKHGSCRTYHDPSDQYDQTPEGHLPAVRLKNVCCVGDGMLVVHCVTHEIALAISVTESVVPPLYRAATRAMAAAMELAAATHASGLVERAAETIDESDSILATLAVTSTVGGASLRAAAANDMSFSSGLIYLFPFCTWQIAY
jgi:hypothetical protein